MTIKFHKEQSVDWLINTPSANTYYNNILKMAGDAFVNAGTGWEYTDTGSYVNTTTTAGNLKIRTVEVHHTISNYYVRFWFIYTYSYYGNGSTRYLSVSSSDNSNEGRTGASSSTYLYFNENNLISSTSNQQYPKMLPFNLFCAVNDSTIGKDFGYDLNTLTCIVPLDYAYQYSYSDRNSSTSWSDSWWPYIIASTSGSNTYPCGYGKIFWTLTDDRGDYTIFGFGHRNSPRKYDNCMVFGNLLNNFDQEDTNRFFIMFDPRLNTNSYPYYYSILSQGGQSPTSTTYRTLSFNSRYSVATTKTGDTYKDRARTYTSFFTSSPLQFQIGNKINYTPLRVYLQAYDSEDTLVTEGQANKGFVNTDYIRYIDTVYPGTAENAWRTFDNKNWMLLRSGYLFRWDPDAPDMRNF